MEASPAASTAVIGSGFCVATMRGGGSDGGAGCAQAGQESEGETALLPHHPLLRPRWSLATLHPRRHTERAATPQRIPFRR